eukprot:scaffold161121_cov19-Tisochrysis_lutea.AAC.1
MHCTGWLCSRAHALWHSHWGPEVWVQVLGCCWATAGGDFGPDCMQPNKAKRRLLISFLLHAQRVVWKQVLCFHFCRKLLQVQSTTELCVHMPRTAYIPYMDLVQGGTQTSLRKQSVWQLALVHAKCLVGAWSGPSCAHIRA